MNSLRHHQHHRRHHATHRSTVAGGHERVKLGELLLGALGLARPPGLGGAGLAQGREDLFEAAALGGGRVAKADELGLGEGALGSSADVDVRDGRKSAPPVLGLGEAESDRGIHGEGIDHRPHAHRPQERQLRDRTGARRVHGSKGPLVTARQKI